MNVPAHKISDTSSKKLCQNSNYIAVSEENRELMRKELERRGQSCGSNSPMPIRTQCRIVGNTQICDTY